MIPQFLSLFSLLILVSCGKAPSMPDYSKKTEIKKITTIELLDPKNEQNFYQLPMRGKINGGSKFWSGDYWPLKKGNINIRWNTPEQQGFGYHSPSKDEALLMSHEELQSLSPTEKFDLLQGRYQYPLKKEAYTHANRFAQDWEGICNGWSPATMNHNEPLPKEFMNPDGIMVPFGSSDIKALLSYYYAYIHKVQTTQQLGRRCPRGPWFNWNQDCKNDLNAGSFHVILANKVGIQKQSFLVDIARYKEIWNHPVVSYQSLNLGEVDPEGRETEGTSKVMRIRTRVTYVDGSDRNTWYPILNSPEQLFVTREYSYNLYLDQNEKIIGGEWKSNDRPDFLWMMEPTQKFEGLLKGLGKLLND